MPCHFNGREVDFASAPAFQFFRIAVKAVTKDRLEHGVRASVRSIGWASENGASEFAFGIVRIHNK